MTNSWWPFIIGGILIVILIAILLFLRSRKTDE
jgi:LPXTG-motif cell wall-anchored protein